MPIYFFFFVQCFFLNNRRTITITLRNFIYEINPYISIIGQRGG